MHLRSTEISLSRSLFSIVMLIAAFTLASSQTKVSGTIKAADGRLLAMANVFLTEANDSTCIETVTAGPQGDYEITIASPGIWLLRFTGVGHREQLVAVYADKPQTLIVNVRLGSYRYLPDFSKAAIVGDFNRWYIPSAVPMKKQRNGTFAADITTGNTAASYRLINVAVGAGIEGTEADRYEYKRYDGYAAVIRANNGKARITFDPRKLAPAGKPGSAVFARPASLEARFAKNFRDMQRVQESYLDALMEARKTRGAKKGFSHDLSRPLSSIQKKIRSERDSILREELWLNCVTIAIMARSTDTALFRGALRGISPASRVWALNPHKIAYALLHSSMTDEQQTEYVRGVIDENPVVRTKTALLLDEFMAAKLADRKDQARAYYDILVNRYGTTPEARMVKERYTP